MSLTEKDILEKTFKRSFKGYDEDEVDKFLDQIIDEIKALKTQNSSLGDELKIIKEQADKIKHTEEAIMHTLVSAQKSSERIMNEAARKAELILQSAESTAKQRKEQTTNELADAEQKLETVKGSAQNFAASFANLINSQAANFEKTYQSNFGDIDVLSGDGMSMDALEKIDKEITQNLQDIAEPEAQLISELKPELDTNKELKEELKPEDETPKESKPKTDKQPEPEAPSKTDDGLMELHEINKALSDLEKGDDILEDSYEKDVSPAEQAQVDQPKKSGVSYKQKYDDYSWLYENDDNPSDDFELSFKDPKEKEELKSLIDEIID